MPNVTIAPDPKLSERELMFAKEYVANGQNGTAAAKAAGYKQPSMQSSRLLKRDKVLHAIRDLRKDIRATAEVELAQVLTELKRIAFSDIRGIFDKDGRLLPPDQWSDEAAAAVAGFDVVTKQLGEGEVEYVAKVKTWDKGAALDKLMRFLGAYAPEEHKVTHDITRIEERLNKGRERVANMKIIEQVEETKR